MGFAGESRKDSQLERYKFLGTLSHLRAQAAGLAHWAQSERSSHFIYTRMFDDTNIWISPQSRATLNEAGETEADPEQWQGDNSSGEDEDHSNSGKQGRRRFAPTMTMLQYLSVRRAGALGQASTVHMDSVKILCPSQVLPKARC